MMRLKLPSIRLYSGGIAVGVAIFAAAIAWQTSIQNHATEASTDPSADIVSIGGSVTEIIYALDQQHRLLARDTTSVYPHAALQLPNVGYVRALSAEGVLSVGPKIVIAENGAGPPEVIDVLQAASIRYVDVPESYSPAGVLDKIRVIGDALNVPDKASALMQSVSNNLQSVTDMVASHTGSPKRVLFILSTQGGRILAAGTDTAAASIISLSGGENAVQAMSGYKPVTNEAIAAAAPDVILMMQQRGQHVISDEDLWSMPALAQTPAAKSGSVVRIDGLLLLGFGPRLPLAATELHRALYEGT